MLEIPGHSEHHEHYASHYDRDIETARAISSLTEKVDMILDRTAKMEVKIEGIVGMTNRWKGATAVLILLGGLVGWLTNAFLKATGRA